MYSEIYLRLEPLGMERVAAAVRAAGHEVRILDLQIFKHRDLFAELESFRPDAVGFSLNYLANVPEVIDLAADVKRLRKGCFVFTGGHSGSFVADELLEHARGNIDAIIRGEGETATPMLLDAIGDGSAIGKVPGVVTTQGSGPTPVMLDDLDQFFPARDLGRLRHKYFIGTLDPCASIEFTRGCPWDCSFCSAWTFYGRSYRKSTPEAAAEDMLSIKEPNVFIVDDVAFIHPEHGFAIGHEIEKRKIKKQYYLETRADVLCRNPEVFKYWRTLGMEYMFLGLEAIDEEGLNCIASAPRWASTSRRSKSRAKSASPSRSI
jgi:hopanoid C-3 methylase HpnR